MQPDFGVAAIGRRIERGDEEFAQYITYLFHQFVGPAILDTKQHLCAHDDTRKDVHLANLYETPSYRPIRFYDQRRNCIGVQQIFHDRSTSSRGRRSPSSDRKSPPVQGSAVLRYSTRPAVV